MEATVRLDQVERRLKLRELHILLTVVRAGSMAKAATDLAISQPNVSKAIADLEHTFGVRLLDRTSRGVEPTTYGLAVIKRATAVFDELRQSVKEVEFLANPTSGELRLGCSDFAAGIVGVTIERMSRRYPRITFEVVSAGAAELQRQLESRNIEFFVAMNQETLSEADFVAEILYDDPLIVVADAHHPLTRRPSIKLAELVHEPWAMPPANTSSGRHLREFFHTHRLGLPTTIVSTYSTMLRHHLVGTAGFITVLPRPMFEVMAKGLSIKALAVHLPTPRRTVVLVVLKKRTLRSRRSSLRLCVLLQSRKQKPARLHLDAALGFPLVAHHDRPHFSSPASLTEHTGHRAAH
jgi:DNA-binding transcriptional LysR family regulator